jgi:hypothetical protein
MADFVWKGKTEPKILPFWTPASTWKDHEPYFFYEQIDHIAQFGNKFLPCSNTQPVSSFLLKICAPWYFHIAITVVLLTRVSQVGMHEKTEEITYDIGSYWVFTSKMVKTLNYPSHFKLSKTEF